MAKRDNYSDYCLMIKCIPRIINSTFDNVLTSILSVDYPSIIKVHVIDSTPDVESQLLSYKAYRDLWKTTKESGNMNKLHFGFCCCKKEYDVLEYTSNNMKKLDAKVDSIILGGINEITPMKKKKYHTNI